MDKKSKYLEKQKIYYQNHKDERIKYAKDYRTKNRNIIREKDRLFYLKNREKKIWNTAKRRAKQKQIEFSIEISDIVIPEFCPVLGIRLCKNNTIKKHNSPSLDRIDNNKGYIQGNIRISDRANTLKSDGLLQEHFLIFLDALQNQKFNYEKVEEIPDSTEEQA